MTDRGLASNVRPGKSAGFWRSVNGVYTKKMAQYRPELIIRLGIDIDTAISRKPDHDYAELQDKIGVMSTIGYNGTKILEIDSRAPYSEVLEQAQKAVSLVAIVSDRRSLT